MFFLLFISLLTGSAEASEYLFTGDASMVQARPRRVRRPLTLGGELGINGLTGFGPAVSYTFSASWSLDVAAGVSAQLARGGLRARYCFFPGSVSPFIGVGAMYALGTPYELKGFDRDQLIVYRIAGAPLGQGVLGVVYHHRSGLTLLAALGWAQLLTRGSNVIVEQGSLSASQLRGIRWATGSGPVASLAVGYSL